MARLPQPGSDEGQWGDILNSFLSQVHKPDGTLKNGSVTAPVIADGAIAETKLAPVVQAKINTVTGAQGPTGPQGPAGTPGAPGATGPAGTQGTPGATGATGPEGPAGADGTSVSVAGSVSSSAALPTNLTAGDAGTGYLTNDNGHLHVWSGASWTDVGEIRGPQGPAGATGPQGPSGTPGTPGTAGTNGATGATGPSGAPGTSGGVGATGATGATGPAGVGTQGAPGATGATGPAGLNTLAAVPAGMMVAVTHNGTSWPNRPTSRTDVVVTWIGPTPPTIGGSGAVAGVDVLYLVPDL